MATTAASRGRVRKTRERENLAVRVGSVALLGLVLVLLLTFWMLGQGSIDRYLVPWVILVAAASVWPVGESEGVPYLALDLPILLACAICTGPFSAGLVALVATVTPQELRGRTTLSRSIWNHSQVALSVIAAGFVYRLVGGDPSSWPWTLVAAELALAADAATNYFSVALIYALASGRKLTSVLATLHVGDPRHFAALYAGLGVLAAIMATLYVLVGAVALVATVVVVALAREALDQAQSAAVAREDLEARRAALRCVDERISEERADERKRIAEALHDDVLQSIFDVTIRGHVVRECYRRGQLLELEHEVPALVAASERVADELRDVIHGLRQSLVGLGGLVGSVSLLVSHLRDQSGMSIVPDLDPTLRIDSNSELVAYQVAREALTNAVRHSHAETIWVSLAPADGGVELRVLDNGVGFDTRLKRAKHFGLELMAERVAAVGGDFQMTSSPGNGVSLVALFGARGE